MVKLQIGMDVGTTNSAIAVLDANGNAEIMNLPNSNHGILPSCVKYLSRTEVEVGVSAYKERYLPSVAYSMKVHMSEGESYHKHIIAENGEEFDVDSIEVASHVIKAMLDGVRAKYEDFEYDKITITVPAYFSEIARYHTAEAGARAGLDRDKIDLINEPTSAALSYGLNTTTTLDTVLVYDLGGGTFDVTLLDISQTAEGPHYEVISSDGDPHLGGDDIDHKIAQSVIDSIPLKIESMLNDPSVILGNVNLPNEIKERLYLACEAAKKAASPEYLGSFVFNVEESWLEPEDVQVIKDHDVQFPIKVICAISYSMVEKAVKDVFNITKKKIDNLMAEKGYTFDTVKKILLVGGSTKSTILVNIFKKLYGNVQIKSYTDPDKSVAQGAAIHTGMITTGTGGSLTDVIQIPIGIKLLDKTRNNRPYIQQLIPKDLHLPVTEYYIGTTAYDNQDVIELEVYQGTSSYAKECQLLGKIVIDDIPKLPAGQIKAKITLNVSINGTLSLTINQRSDDGKYDKIYSKELVRLSSTGTEDAPKDPKQMLLERRLSVIREKVKDPEMAEKAVADFLELNAKDPSKVAMFLGSLKKYNQVTDTTDTTPRSISGGLTNERIDIFGDK